MPAKKPSKEEIPAPAVEESTPVAIEHIETVIPEAAQEVEPHQEETPPIVENPQNQPKEPAVTVAPDPEARVKVRVLINATKVAGGTAAKGKRLNVKLSEAKLLESLGKVQILGV